MFGRLADRIAGRIRKTAPTAAEQDPPAPDAAWREAKATQARSLGLFNDAWYLSNNPDVAANGIDPFHHYLQSGWKEGRRPAPGFDEAICARASPTFVPGSENPILHLLSRGVTARDLRRGREARRQAVPSAPVLPTRLDDGLCITGYLTSEIGLGQAARNLAYACDAARLPLSFRDIALAGRQNDAEFRSKCNPLVDRKAHLLVAGLPSVSGRPQDLQPGRMNILYAFWELQRIPTDWLPAIGAFDEVWAPSRFVAMGFAAVLGKPVQLVPQPVRLPRTMPPPRGDRRQLRFLTYLDFDSFVRRKNPQAVVKAFTSAFPPSNRDVELVVKTRGSRDDGLRRWLGEAAAQDARIRVVDRTIGRAEMDSLMSECDAFVSLHRSEGFGFGVAEALAAGKAVVATDFSGTTDLLTDQTGYPVAYDLEPVRDGEYLAAEGQSWASARHEAAVAALRQVAADLHEAENRTRRGFALLQQRHAPEAVGRLVAGLLRQRGMV